MADNITEPPPPPEPPPTPEQSPIPEYKSQLINRALSEFDGVRNDSRQLSFAGQNFAEQTNQSLWSLSREPANANPAEPGYRQTVGASEQVVGFIQPKLAVMSEAAKRLGINNESEREQLEEVLKKAAIEQDPIKSYALAQDALEAFNKTVTQIRSQGDEQLTSGRVVARGAEENETNAGITYARISEQIKSNLDQSLVTRYARSSAGFNRVVSGLISTLSTADSQFIMRTEEHKAVFIKLVEEVTRPPSAPE